MEWVRDYGERETNPLKLFRNMGKMSHASLKSMDWDGVRDLPMDRWPNVMGGGVGG